MRNEEANAEECLDSLLAQDYPALEIIVVNDHSTDSTGKIIERIARRDGRIKTVPAKPLEAGWTGKNFAVHQAVQRARGRWLAFVDADTRHAPQFVSLVLGYARKQRVDMFSILPQIECGTFWERVMQPTVFALILGAWRLHRVNDPSSDKCFANGQFIMINRETYSAIGGHEAVKDRQAEDYALARAVKNSGRNLKVVIGLDLMRTRMYKGMREVWNGWSRLFFEGMNESLPYAAYAVATVFLLSILPYFLLAGLGVKMLAVGGGVLDLVALILAGAAAFCSLSYEYLTMRHMREDVRYAVFDPIANCILVAMMINSVMLPYTRSSLTWKGRRYY